MIKSQLPNRAVKGPKRKIVIADKNPDWAGGCLMSGFLFMTIEVSRSVDSIVFQEGRYWKFSGKGSICAIFGKVVSYTIGSRCGSTVGM